MFIELYNKFQLNNTIHCFAGMSVLQEERQHLSECVLYRQPANKCCKRWYFTFNNKECSTPGPIGAIIIQNNKTTGGPTTQQGYCGGIGKGNVMVRFSVGICAGSGDNDATTGWKSVSTIVIQEVEPPQE